MQSSLSEKAFIQICYLKAWQIEQIIGNKSMNNIALKIKDFQIAMTNYRKTHKMNHNDTYDPLMQSLGTVAIMEKILHRKYKTYCKERLFSEGKDDVFIGKYIKENWQKYWESVRY